jgi:hypothetical protein
MAAIATTRQHAEDVRDAALVALADRRPDRRMIGGLLAVISEAWIDASSRPISVSETLRWSAVCALAERIAREVNPR